jgi:hypothetical protein
MARANGLVFSVNATRARQPGTGCMDSALDTDSPSRQVYMLAVALIPDGIVTAETCKKS